MSSAVSLLKNRTLNLPLLNLLIKEALNDDGIHEFEIQDSESLNMLQISFLRSARNKFIFLSI